MALQNFVDKVTTVATSWLNSVDVLLDTVFGTPTTKAQARAALTSDAPMSLGQGGTGATTAAAARTALGSTATGDAVFTAASAAAARTSLGSTAVGDAVFIAVDATAARVAIGASGVLYRSGATVSVVNTTTAEAPLFTYTIPANTIGTNKIIRLTAPIKANNTSGGAIALTLRVKFGTTTITTWATNIPNTATTDIFNFTVLIDAKNATNSQAARILIGYASGAIEGILGVSSVELAFNESLAEDTTANKDLVITAQWASTGATATAQCINSIVELL